jgi:endonuclease YncB( thermonuclease family)
MSHTDTLRGPDGQRYVLEGIPRLYPHEYGYLAARSALRALIKGQTLECVTLSTDRWGRKVVQCIVEGYDLGCALVETGSIPWPDVAGKEYQECMQ